MTTPNYAKAKEEAQKLLDSMSITEPVVNVFEIAEREGIKIDFFDSQSPKLHNVAGFFDPNEKKIYVNNSDPANRQVFTIAHELGHYKLGHKPEEYGVLMRWQRDDAKKPIEKEADEFAGNLLVPEGMLTKLMKQYKLDGSELDIDILSRLFGVSKDVIKIRISRLRKPFWA